MLEKLKTDVWKANLDLVERGLVVETFGNVSGVDRVGGFLVIKPSGVDYKEMQADDMVVVSLETGKVVEGKFNPSSDTPTHLVLYRSFPGIGGVVHTHSFYATSWAQTARDLPAFGTTHADYCHGSIPCTRLMQDEEIASDYEANTGHVIVERFQDLSPESVPFVLVASHGPFVWGPTVEKAVSNAAVLEYLAMLASQTLHIRRETEAMQNVLMDKHFFRKHGANAYYGQK